MSRIVFNINLCHPHRRRSFNSRKKSKISNIKSFSCDSEMRKGVDEGLI